MKLRPLVFLTAAACLTLLLVSGSSRGGGEKKEDKKDEKKQNSAATPSPRKAKGGMEDAKWMTRHDGFVATAKKGNVDVLLQGDSITDGWSGKGKAVYEKSFAPLKTANFGIGGDRVEHVLWRQANGELDGISPKVIMLMIGTNNSGSNTPEEAAEGISLILKQYHEKAPNAKVLLLGIFPRDADLMAKNRIWVNNVNKIISKYDDKKSVFYKDIGDVFIEKDGKLKTDLFYDRSLHPNAEGYQLWADAVMPTINEWLAGAK